MSSFRSYYWGDDEVEATKPNLAHDGIEVRWYKHPGRSMTLNAPPEPDVMIKWFDSVLAHVRKLER